ncbi:VHS1040 protein [Vibrio phage 1]|nr:VHS1040 protein [Vibrio phage 1]
MINYQASQIINAVKANITAMHNIASHTDNKHVENRLAASNLNKTLGALSAFDPSEPHKTCEHLEGARALLVEIFLREDHGVPSILSQELNKQVAYNANMLFSLATQIETLSK